jgi:aryl-alcohol dehydrogenase-like predicted oxidoreductase
MQFCLQEKRIGSVISGAARVAEIETNLRALSEPIDVQLLAEVRQILAPVLNQTWPNGNWKE